MNIKENGTIFTNGEMKIQVKDIVNGDNLIEVELIENSKNYDTIDKLKKAINELELPVDTSDYFIKKAEVELAKLLK